MTFDVRILIVAISLLTHSFWIPLSPVKAQSESALLANIKPETIDAAVQWLGNGTATAPPLDAARLVWHVMRLEPSVLADGSTALSAAMELSPLTTVTVTGTATRVKAFGLSSEAREYLELERIFVVTVEPDGMEASVRILTGAVPDKWNSTDALAEPIRCDGVLLAAGEAESLVVAPRLQWYPTAGTAGSGARPHEVALAAAGFDVARLDTIQSRATQGLNAEPAAAFYGMLGALPRIPSAQFDQAAHPIQPTDLLAGEYRESGQFVRFRVETRRITRIAVADGRPRELLGQDHYWQIDAFGDLGRTRVLLETGKPGERPIELDNRYPISIVSARLPESLQRAVGDGTVLMQNQPIEVAGVNYRLWSYRSDFITGRGGERQIAPLVMAYAIRDVEPGGVSAASMEVLSFWVAGIFLSILVAVILVLLWVGRRDKAARARLRRAESRPEWDGL